MDYSIIFSLAVAIFFAAMLYASVGHGGGSGYLAAMALVGVAPGVMKPTALVLNILVATLATLKFRKAGCFKWPIFWPFTVTSVPLAYLGGRLQLPGTYYNPLVGSVLLFTAVRLLLTRSSSSDAKTKPVPVIPALLVGAGVGFLAGSTGVGGGIFLSPLLLYGGWATTRETSGTTAPFILVNSVAGLLGAVSSLSLVPTAAAWWGAAAVVGGWIGAEVGSRRFNTPWLRRLLGVTLVIAGIKLILT